MRISNYPTADRVLGHQPEVQLPGTDTYLHELDFLTELHGAHEQPPIGLRYKHTNVLIYLPNGDIVYHHGGWTTGTTAKRMAGWGPEHVEIIFQKGAMALKVQGRRYEFGDDFALVVHPDGTVEPYDGPVE